jgi:AraC-like DNA-binding protein/ligand-binding sensor protein
MKTITPSVKGNGRTVDALRDPAPAPDPGAREVINQLAQSRYFKEYQDAFSHFTGLPLALRSRDFWQLPMHECLYENPLCQSIADNQAACAACLELQMKLTNSAQAAPAAMTCPLGLIDIAVPVKLDGECQAYLHTGQFYLRQPSAGRFKSVLRRLREWHVETDVTELKAAFASAAVLSHCQQDALMQLLNQFAIQLSAQANRILLNGRQAEPPLITQAKQYMAENLAEPISLDDISRYLHVSTYYFCKQFKKHTGLRFTDYFVRLRIEYAKRLLGSNPHLRVSEVACDVGFISLPHFNRSFKRVTGQTPTNYRKTCL